jgi:hypothetical protein
MNAVNKALSAFNSLKPDEQRAFHAGLLHPPEAVQGDDPGEQPTPEGTTEEAKPRYTVRNAAFAMLPQPPIKYIVDKLIVAGSVNIIYGAPGAKKTYSLLSMASCVALGKTWLDYATEQVKVLWVDEESGETHLSRRLSEAIRGESGGQETPIEFVCRAGWRLDDLNDIAILQTLIKETGAGLVIFDALADIMTGDENMVKDVRPALLNAGRIAETTGAAIVLIHHSNKTGGYRGSSFILGNVDTMIHTASESGSMLVNFKTDKVRHGEAQSWAAVAMWSEEQFYLKSTEGPKIKPKYKPGELFVIRYLREHGESEVNAIKNAADTCSRGMANTAIYALARAGITERTNPVSDKNASYRLTEAGQKVEL